MALAFEPLSHKVDHMTQNKIMYSKFERSSNTNKEQNYITFLNISLYINCIINVWFL